MILLTIVVALFVGIFMIGPFVLAPGMAVFCAIMFIMQLREHQKLNTVKPTPLVCPFCGSNNVEIRCIDENMARFQASYHHKMIYQINETGDVLTETLFCKNCNKESQYISQYKLNSVKGDKKGMLVIWAIVLFSSCIMGIYFWCLVVQK